jgi:hypothetical protein
LDEENRDVFVVEFTWSSKYKPHRPLIASQSRSLW